MSIELFLLSFPIWFLALIFVGGSMLVAGCLTRLVTHRIPFHIHIENNILAGYIYQAMVGLFSVLLAFVIMIVWQDFTKAKESVEQEADHLEIIYYVADGLPEPQHSEFKETLISYTESVIDQEWPLMAQGKRSDQAGIFLRKMLNVSLSLDTQSYHEAIVLQKLGDELSAISTLRQKRLSDSRSYLEPALWIMLCSGGFALVGFALTFRSRNDRIQILMTMGLAGLISFALLLVLVLDLPFSGDIHVSNEVFVQLLSLLKSP
jgi:hypothetical protein